jgi:hypothetical protein
MVAGGVAVGLAGIGGGAAVHAATSSHLLHHDRMFTVIAPVKGQTTTLTSDLNEFVGPVTDRNGKTIGNVQGYCVALNAHTGQAECTTTFFFTNGDAAPESQLTITGPSYKTSFKPMFTQAVTGGTGMYRNVLGQVDISTQTPSNNVVYSFDLIPGSD